MLKRITALWHRPAAPAAVADMPAETAPVPVQAQEPVDLLSVAIPGSELHGMLRAGIPTELAPRNRSHSFKIDGRDVTVTEYASGESSAEVFFGHNSGGRVILSPDFAHKVERIARLLVAELREKS